MFHCYLSFLLSSVNFALHGTERKGIIVEGLYSEGIGIFFPPKFLNYAGLSFSHLSTSLSLSKSLNLALANKISHFPIAIRKSRKIRSGRAGGKVRKLVNPDQTLLSLSLPQ